MLLIQLYFFSYIKKRGEGTSLLRIYVDICCRRVHRLICMCPLAHSRIRSNTTSKIAAVGQATGTTGTSAAVPFRSPAFLFCCWHLLLVIPVYFYDFYAIENLDFWLVLMQHFLCSPCSYPHLHPRASSTSVGRIFSVRGRALSFCPTHYGGAKKRMHRSKQTSDDGFYKYAIVVVLVLVLEGR